MGRLCLIRCMGLILRWCVIRGIFEVDAPGLLFRSEESEWVGKGIGI
jgi:hypothetical protein